MRLFRVWLVLLKQSFLADLEYRLAFLLAVLAGLAWIVLNLATLELIFDHTRSLAGWSKYAVFLLFGVYRLLDAIYAMFVKVNLEDLVSFVHTGKLDLFLTKPLPSRFHLTLRRWRFYELPNILTAGLIIIYAERRLGIPVGLPTMLLFAIACLAALVITSSLGTAVSSLIFWTQGTKNINDVHSTLVDGGRVPVGIFRGRLRPFFTFVIPVAFLGTFPARVFQGIAAARLTGLSLLVAAIFLLLSQWIWRQALRSYASASS
jgi:ABC-2 type transport system permease protein